MKLEAHSYPNVSVVVPAYNAGHTIRRALASVACQTRPPLETIVVDDCSIDDTRSVVEQYDRVGIKLIRMEKHQGVAAARNIGVQAANGEVIAFLDADDEWLPIKLQKQLTWLTADPRLWFVSCDSDSISQSGTNLGNTYGGARIAAGSEAWKALLSSNFIATPSVVVWRRHLVALGGFDESLKIGEDQDMWIRLAASGPLGYVPETLLRVHLRTNSLSRWSLEDLLDYTLPMIERHISSQRPRLTEVEIRRILGERYNRFGRVAYVRGEFWSGLRLISRSVGLGYHPFESLVYLMRAAPPILWLKHRLGFGAVS